MDMRNEPAIVGLKGTVATHEIAPEMNSTLGGSPPSGKLTSYTARNCAIVSHKESSEKNFPGQTLFITRGHSEDQLRWAKEQIGRTIPASEPKDIAGRVIRGAVKDAVLKIPLGLEGHGVRI